MGIITPEEYTPRNQMASLDRLKTGKEILERSPQKPFIGSFDYVSSGTISVSYTAGAVTIQSVAHGFDYVPRV